MKLTDFKEGIINWIILPILGVVIIIAISPIVSALLQVLIYLWCAVFFVALILFVVNPTIYTKYSTNENKYMPISFSLKYVWQTIKHFLLIQMIPGMLIFTMCLINEEITNMIIKSHIILGFAVILGPTLLGCGIMILINWFKQQQER